MTMIRTLPYLSAILSIPVLAQPGRLDMDFGMGGIARTTVAAEFVEVGAVEVLPDQRILAGGYAYIDNAGDILLARLLPDGGMDPEFGNAGVVIHDDGNTEYAVDLALLDDGNFLVLAERFVSTSQSDILLLRFNSNGTLDGSFGTNGRVILEGATSDIPSSMVVRPDGRLLIAGGRLEAGNGSMLIWGLLADGTIDTDFGTSGLVLIDVTPQADQAQGIALQEDGRIVLGGRGQGDSPGNVGIVAARLLADGTLDGTFGTNGTVALGGNSSITSIANVVVGSDGKILLGGHTQNMGAVNQTLVRFDSNGELDNSLDGDGILYHAVGLYAFTNAMVHQPDGRIILGGAGTDDGFVLTRFTSVGDVDLTFSDGIEDNIAQVVTAFPGNYTQAEALALQADGQVLAGGGVANDLVIVRYQNSVTSAVKEQPTARRFHVYPNPIGADGLIRFDLEGMQDPIRLELLDTSGQVVQSNFWNASAPAVIDVHALAPGSYVVRAHYRDGLRSVATVVMP